MWREVRMSQTEDEDKEERKEINLRLPKSLCDEARRRANSKGISLNAWISSILSEKLEDQGKVSPFRR